MGRFVILAALLAFFVAQSSGCFQCLVGVDESMRLCWGHVDTKYNIRNQEGCFNKIDRIFNYNDRVIQAGRVGGGYDKLLRGIMLSQILPLMEEFDNKRNPDYVYEERLQTAADYFIAEASKLPRATGCYPPCGFQISGNVYDCVTCLYDSCEYPLDCAMRDSTVGEYNSTEIRCDVHFPLPSSIEIVWRFAPQVRTQQVEQFGLVTVGDDQHFSIPSAQSRHQGTYQCEVFSYQRSIVRTYHHLTVIPQDTVAQSRLQGVFDMALFPGGRFPDQPGGLPPDQAPPPATGPQLVPAPSLLTACLFALSLLLFLSLG